MLTQPLITLTTDFGIKDPFAGVMKGVLLKINPGLTIVDITHNIERHNITDAADVIASCFEYFPDGTIHIVVVDPGVGSSRRPILVVSEKHAFIGPDNGVFSGVYDKLGKGFFTVFHLTKNERFLKMEGPTFHGRDIFAPVAAWLSKSTAPEKLGDPIGDYTVIITPVPTVSGRTIRGEIISIDSFGNCISNIRSEDLERLCEGNIPDDIRITYNKREVPLAAYYEANGAKSLSAVINSSGRLELFIFKGSAEERFKIKKGDSVEASLF